MEVKRISAYLAIAALAVAASACTQIQADPDGTPASGPAAHSVKVDAKALIDAYEDNGMARVRALVREGADINASHRGDGTVLMLAAKNGDVAAVNELLALGADANISNRSDGTAVITAAGAGHLAVVESLVAAGANIDALTPYDETALIAASRKGRSDVVRYLVSQNANVNLGVTTPSGQWRTPLNQASTQEIRELLVANGAAATRQ